MSRVTLKRKHRQLCIGDLNKRIKIQNRNIRVPDFEKADFDERFSGPLEVWAKFETVSGQTVFIVNQDFSFTHLISIRFNSTVSSESWIEFENSRFNILTVQDLEERHEWMILKCVEKGSIDKNATKS